MHKNQNTWIGAISYHHFKIIAKWQTTKNAKLSEEWKPNYLIYHIRRKSNVFWEKLAYILFHPKARIIDYSDASYYLLSNFAILKSAD